MEPASLLRLERPFDELWQDREVGFDVPAARLAPRRGEEVVDELASVEDTKSGRGERGLNPR
jgi:hypothetical protein